MFYIIFLHSNMCVEALPRAGRMGPKILKKCGQTNNRENVSTHFRTLLGEKHLEMEM